MESENEEGEEVITYKTKYRQLKSRLKYLIYEHECFENDIQKAQMKLLQLSRDKSFLLDQLLRYETVVLSGGEETDYSSGEETGHLPTTSATSKDKTEHSATKGNSEPLEQVNKSPAPPPVTSSTSTSVRTVTTATVKSAGTATATPGTVLVTTHGAIPSTKVTAAPVKSNVGGGGGGRKTMTKGSATKVSATAAAKITKAVARARQSQQKSPTVNIGSSSPLIVSLPLGNNSIGGRSKPHPQAPPTKPSNILSLQSGGGSTTAAILASIPAPPRPKPAQPIPVAGKPLPSSSLQVGVAKGAGPQSSSSSSSSSSDSEDSGSESSSSGGSSKEDEDDEAMDTGGPVPIVHSVPVPSGGPQLLKPKAIVSPVKGPPPKLIPMSSSGVGVVTSPLTTPTGVGGVTRFLWSSRPGAVPTSGVEATPSLGFVAIAPLSSPTTRTKPGGSAFQLVTSPPGSAPLSRPPSLQDLSGEVEPTDKPHPPPQ